MPRTALLVLSALCLSYSLPCRAVHGDNWPGWRGPTGQGLCGEMDLPVKWSTTENIRWNAPLPDEGNSSPVVWGGRVFLTQASQKTLWPPKRPADFPKGTSAGGAAVAEKRAVMCFDRASGKLLWKRDTIYKQPEPTHRTNPFCSATPVTDGERVIASHGSAGLVCYNMEGELLWKYDVGKLDQIWGNASSPVLYGDLVVLWCGPGSRQFLLALNKRSGEKVWEHVEPGGSSGNPGKLLGAWATPTLARIGEKHQLILPVPYKIKGFDPDTGRELWQASGPGNFVYGSALFEGDLAVFGRDTYQLGEAGVISQKRLARNGGGRGPHSGVVVDGYLYVGGAVPSCIELKTGKEIWKSQIRKRPGTTTAWGSMVHAAGKLYFTDQRGTTLVLAAGPKYEVLATNRLGEHTNASIAVSEGNLFIRTWKHLWCIGKDKHVTKEDK